MFSSDNGSNMHYNSILFLYTGLVNVFVTKESNSFNLLISSYWDLIAREGDILATFFMKYMVDSTFIPMISKECIFNAVAGMRVISFVV